MDAVALSEKMMLPVMSADEISLLDKYTPSGRVLEFGAGGSTVFFASREVQHIATVESDSEWINRLLLGNALLRQCAKSGRWQALHARIGATGEWGVPLSRRPSVAWLNYHQSVWSALDPSQLDFVLIDGRFRVACALQVLLRTAGRSVPVMVHDFSCREHYHVLLHFFDIIDAADTAVVLLRKDNPSWRDAAICLQEYQFVWN
ncbi:MAG: hypothetical protein DESF_00586 [Desulfovibrio sp.]